MPSSHFCSHFLQGGRINLIPSIPKTKILKTPVQVYQYLRFLSSHLAFSFSFCNYFCLPFSQSFFLSVCLSDSIYLFSYSPIYFFLYACLSVHSLFFCWTFFPYDFPSVGLQHLSQIFSSSVFLSVSFTIWPPFCLVIFLSVPFSFPLSVLPFLFPVHLFFCLIFTPTCLFVFQYFS